MIQTLWSQHRTPTLNGRYTTHMNRNLLPSHQIPERRSPQFGDWSPIFPLQKRQPILAHLPLLVVVVILLLAPGMPVHGAPVAGPMTAVPSQDDLPQGVRSNSSSISPQWTPFNAGSGLISNDVTAILADGDTIWFGTDAGISRYDGLWTNFERGEAVPQGSVSTLVQLGDPATIWMGTDQGGLSSWDGQRWQPRAELTSSINALAMVDDLVWVGTNTGIYALMPSGDQADQVAPTPIEEMFSLPEALLNRRISALAQSGDHIFVGTEDGLWVHNGDWTQFTQADELPSSVITAIWVSPTGSIWVGTGAGAAFWNPTTETWLTFITRNIEGDPVAVRSLWGDSLGLVWVGSESGAYRFDEEGNSLQLPGDVGLTTAFVQAIAPDQHGYVWVGTVAGVFRYGQNLWTYERRNDVQFEENGDTTFYIGINQINDLLVDSRNALWIATDAGVRYKVADVSFGDEIYYTAENSQLPSNRILALAEDRDGNIWAGTQTGIARIQQSRWSQDILATDLPHPSVRALASDQDGIWIGTEAGLVFYDLNTQQLDAQIFLADSVVTALSLDGMGRVWAGTRDGGIFLAEEFGQFVPPPSVDQAFSGEIVSLAEDRANAEGIWVGVTQQGISRWDGRRWDNFSTSQGLPSNVMYSLDTFPGDVSLWIGSEAGVTRFDERSWGTFDVKDGELSPSIQAVARNQIDGFWFGGRDGLTFYRPETSEPWVQIVNVSGATVQESTADFTQMVLEKTDGDLRLQLAAGDLHSDQDAITILYRWLTADGDSGWQTTTERQLTFPLPDAGTYQLELTARDKAFNDPPVTEYRMEVVLPPAVISLPLIGPVSRQVFQTLLALTLMAGIAFVYVSSEILQNRRRVRSAMIRGYNPYISGEPVRREDMFFGREELLQRILDTLHSNSIMIHGERRIGKTTLLYQLAARLRETDDPDYWFLPAYVDLEGTEQEDFFHLLMEEIVSALRSLSDMTADQKAVMGLLDYVDTRSDDYTDRDFSRDLRTILEVLDEYGQTMKDGRSLRLILLMDEMDVMSHYDQVVQQRLRRIFMRDFSSSLGAVVAGIQISKAWDRVESPWYNLFNEIELEPFDREQAIELLEDPVREVYSYEPAALEAIIDHSNGRPFRLQQYGLEAITHMLADNRRRVTEADVEVAHARIQEQIGLNGLGQPDGDLSIPGRWEKENSTIDAQPQTAHDQQMQEETTTSSSVAEATPPAPDGMALVTETAHPPQPEISPEQPNPAQQNPDNHTGEETETQATGEAQT